jgi:hypothetical protein
MYLASLFLGGPVGRTVYHAPGSFTSQRLRLTFGQACGCFLIQQLRLRRPSTLFAELFYQHHLFIPALADLQDITCGNLF